MTEKPSHTSGSDSESPDRQLGDFTSGQDSASQVYFTKGVLAFSIPGEPKTKLRPRFGRFKGRVRTYDKQSQEKNTIKWQLRSRMLGIDPFEGPLRVDLIFVFPIPKSRERLREIYHSVKPDIDNCIKWFLDAGNEILWQDDKQIVNLSSIKIYGEKARTIITVSRVNGNRD